MEWSDHGIILSARRHGEGSLIVQLLTERHGRHAGLVRGGTGKRTRGVYLPGNTVSATWRARLADHLGNYSCELLGSRAAALLDDPVKLAGLSSLCAVAEIALPEREAHPAVYRGFMIVLDAFEAGDWHAPYVRWELGLLAELGYGLDLARCAATGRNDALAYVSPRSGRAVSLSAGEPYRDRLLPLPPFLIGATTASAADVQAGLRLTGYFLETRLFGPEGRALPAARQRLVDRLGAPAGATAPIS
jgi:DNA repair protein RecO (recombination protein O)